MPVYAYRCQSCGHERDSLRRDDAGTCEICGGRSSRDYGSVSIGSSFRPHFNHAVGAHVSTERQFLDKLKARSEENSIRTGTTHEYSMVYPGDVTPTKDTEILETRAKLIHDKGITARDLGVDV